MGLTHAQLLMVIIPVVIVGLGLMIFCLVDLLRPDRHVRGGDKRIWGAVILLGSTLGQLLYLLYGREDY